MAGADRSDPGRSQRRRQFRETLSDECPPGAAGQPPLRAAVELIGTLRAETTTPATVIRERHFVIVDGRIERRQHRLGFGINNCHGGICAGERADAVHGFPQCHRQQFHAIVDRATQQRSALITGDGFEMRNDRRRKMTLIAPGFLM